MGRSAHVRDDAPPQLPAATDLAAPSSAAPRHKATRPGAARLFQVLGTFILVLGAAGGVQLALRGDATGTADALDERARVIATQRDAVDGAALAAREAAKAAAQQAAADESTRVAAANQALVREQAPPTAVDVPSSCDAYTGNRAIGCALLLGAGWGLDQMPCLDKLWTRESNWRVEDENTSSGAYGIPQALPGDKMAVDGADWRTNPATQIRWGLDYIRNRYGSPCAAWDHSEATGWY